MQFNISLEDLIIAYRKVKSDLYFDEGSNMLIKLAEYEQDLLSNLNRLYKKLQGDPDWFLTESFLGGFSYVLKEVESENTNRGVYNSDTNVDWEQRELQNIEFRFVGEHSVDFHVITSLWIDLVGEKLESRLSENCYGCRIRRSNQTFNKFVTNPAYGVNPKNYAKLAGHFRPYHWDYKRWQNDALQTIQDALKAKKKLIVLTGDIRKFYSSITAEFLIDPAYYKFLRIEDSPLASNPLTRLIVQILHHWSYNSRNNISQEVAPMQGHCGLPVGASISKVIANLFLAYFDHKIESEITPLHYGRYVDDIIIVLENKAHLNNAGEIWQYFARRIPEINIVTDVKDEHVRFTMPFAEHVQVTFNRGKERTFVLEGDSAESFISAIKESLEKTSSEWRLLPDAEEDIEALDKQITSGTSTTEEELTNLGKSDGLSIQRLRFALKLRNFETLVYLLPKRVWKNDFDQFIGICTNFILSPQRIDAYLKYYPRIIGLALKAKEYNVAKKLIERLDECWHLLQLKVGVAGFQDSMVPLISAREHCGKLIQESIAVNCPINRNEYLKLREADIILLDEEHLSKKLFLADLHAIPYKKLFLQPSLKIRLDKKRRADWFALGEILANSTLFEIEDFKNLYHLIESHRGISTEVPNSLFLYTRPFNTLELTSLIKSWCSSQAHINNFNTSLALFGIPPVKVDFEQDSDEDLIRLNVQAKLGDIKPRIALTSFETDEKSWTAAVREDGIEPDSTRYKRLFKILNAIIDCKEKIDYVVFPELSIPRGLITYLAGKLKSKNISLIAGLEYEFKKESHLKNIKGKVSNQLLYILNVDNGNYIEQVAVVQEKVIPAYHEERHLYDEGGQVLEAQHDKKYIIRHDKFFFSGLICNELLNIDYRQPLKGKIDAMFVVEWNKDIDMYDPIIVSTSNDLHCYMIQVNNRKYGDTRMRAPYKEGHLRDKVRIRGGEMDYFVIAAIDIEGLREFQRFHRSPDGPFKPVPSGYEMSRARRKIDLTDK